ncbi:hypothetical protein D9M68_847090 [compost metagenome]
MATNDEMSSTPERSARLRKASSRLTPMRSSSASRFSSSDSASLRIPISLAARFMAASRPRPASTQTIIKSSASGSAFCRLSRRWATIRESTTFGR